MAVLVEDCVTSSGTRMLVELGHREVAAAVIASEQMCAGMVLEAADEYVASRSEQSYLDSIGGKTAALLSLACRVGAMQADCSDEQVEALAEFGRYFGLAYQLWDDILDATSTAEEMGKPVNTDMFEGIYTLPVIRAAARDQSLACLLGRRTTREQAARARKLVLASGAVDEAQAVAEKFLDQARDQLAGLPVDPRVRHAMSGLPGRYSIGELHARPCPVLHRSHPRPAESCSRHRQWHGCGSGWWTPALSPPRPSSTTTTGGQEESGCRHSSRCRWTRPVNRPSSAWAC